MQLQDGSSVVGNLTTVGRKTGQRRTVELRFTYYQGCFYASSSRVQGKHWCQNMLKAPSVELSIKGEQLPCVATQVTDRELHRYILTLRDSPPRLDRVVFATSLTPGNRRSNGSNRSSRFNGLSENDFYFLGSSFCSCIFFSRFSAPFCIPSYNCFSFCIPS